MNISEKAAYLKGLINGMEYDASSKEGKLFAGIIDLLEDLAVSVQDLEDETATLGDYVEELDEDLGALEEECYGCDCCDDDDDDECCDCCGDDDDECDCCGDFDEIKCPACGETIYVDTDALPDNNTIVCPACNSEIELEDDGADE